MITQSAEKSPSDPVFCLFECLFSAFVNDFLLSFSVININNQLCRLLCHTLALNVRSHTDCVNLHAEGG